MLSPTKISEFRGGGLRCITSNLLITDLPLNNTYWIIGSAVGIVMVLAAIVISVIICRTRAKRRTKGGWNNKTSMGDMHMYKISIRYLYKKT